MFYFKPPIKTLCFQTSKEDFYFFCFTPCVTVINRWCTQMVIPSRVLCRLCCHLFELVATHFLSILLCFYPLPSTPSLCFIQRATAFLLSFLFNDPTAVFSAFLRSFHALNTLESFPYILPRFCNSKQVVLSMDAHAIQLYNFDFRWFL